MKYGYIVYAFIVCVFHASAQNDTMLVGYSADDPGSSFLNELAIFQGDKYGVTQRTTTGYKAYISGSDGHPVHTRSLDQVEGYQIHSSSWMFDDATKFVYIGNATKGNQPFFIVFSLDTALSEIRLIDTLALAGAEQLFFDIMKYNTDLSAWEGFGMVQLQGGGAITGIHYIALDANFHFVKSRRLSGDYHPGPVLEFQWVKEVGRYFLSIFGGRNLLVDAEQQWVKEQEDVRLTYVLDNVQYTVALRMYNCFSAEGSRIYCYGKEFSDRPYNVSMVTLDVANDSVRLAEALPLNQPSLGMAFASQMRKDREGNYVVSGVNSLTAPQPNQLNVAKFSAELDQIWTFSFDSDKSFIIWDMEIDDHNDIVLVGQAWNIFGDGQPHGFLMKVFDNGTLVSYEEIPPAEMLQLYPNPNAGFFFIESELQPLSVRLRDMSGRQVFESSMFQSGLVRLPEGLPHGVYTAEISLENGKRVSRKIVVAGN